MDIAEAAARRYPEEQRGRCASCGFFGFAGRSGWYEISPRMREVEILPHVPDPNANPDCFRFAANLSEEFNSAIWSLQAEPDHRITDDEGNPTEDFRPLLHEILYRDRHCEEWYPYTPGLSPKEHLEQFLMLQLERERQLIQAQLADDNVKIAEATRDTAQILKKTKEFGTKSTIIIIGLTVLVLIVSTLALLVAVGVIARRG